MMFVLFWATPLSRSKVAWLRVVRVSSSWMKKMILRVKGSWRVRFVQGVDDPVQFFLGRQIGPPLNPLQGLDQKIQGDEVEGCVQFFFVAEIKINGGRAEFGPLGDVFDTGGFETLLHEEFLGRLLNLEATRLLFPFLATLDAHGAHCDDDPGAAGRRVPSRRGFGHMYVNVSGGPAALCFQWCQTELRTRAAYRLKPVKKSMRVET